MPRRDFIAIEAMKRYAPAAQFGSGEDGIFSECRSCRFHRPFPGLVRPREGGGYEMIAGHRRHRASELAERDTVAARETAFDRCIPLNK